MCTVCVCMQVHTRTCVLTESVHREHLVQEQRRCGEKIQSAQLRAHEQAKIETQGQIEHIVEEDKKRQEVAFARLLEVMRCDFCLLLCVISIVLSSLRLILSAGASLDFYFFQHSLNQCIICLTLNFNKEICYRQSGRYR